MNRRNFVKVMGLGTAGTVLIPSIFSGCSSTPLVALEGWEGPSSEEKDIRIIVLSYAILAANPHNKQPWLIDLKSPTQMDLYVDQARLLPETDPPFRQVHIGQGTFLENLSLAATAHGYVAKIEYFPRGMYSNVEVLKKPVATVTLEESKVSVDPIFPEIVRRQSNKRQYDSGRTLKMEHVQNLQTFFNNSDYDFHITQDPGKCKEIAAILTEAMKIETRKQERHLESTKMFRMNNAEIEKYRDGFSIAQLGYTGFVGWVVETFFMGSREDAEDPESSDFKSSIDLTNDGTQKQAESASTFGWIVSKTNTRLDQVKVGRVYQRVNLEATRLGLAQHPMSQVLQEYKDMVDLQKEFLKLLKIPSEHTVQMLFRLGFASPVIHTPRRRINDLLMKS